MPVDALWRRAANRMQPPIVNALGLSPFSVGSPPSAAMLVYAGLYCALCVHLAVRWFASRDL